MPEGHDSGTHAAAVRDCLKFPACPHLTLHETHPHAPPLPPQNPYFSSLCPEPPAPLPPNVVLAAPHFLSVFYPFVTKDPQPSLSFDSSQVISFAP